MTYRFHSTQPAEPTRKEIRDCKAHWKQAGYRWKAMRSSVESQIKDIEDADLQRYVTWLYEALRARRGALYIEGEHGHNTHLRATSFDLDDDVVDAIEAELAERGVDPEVFERAGIWLMQNLVERRASLPFLGWLFGELAFSSGDKSRAMSDRFVYCFAQKRFIGVYTQGRPGGEIMVPMEKLT